MVQPSKGASSVKTGILSLPGSTPGRSKKPPPREQDMTPDLIQVNSIDQLSFTMRSLADKLGAGKFDSAQKQLQDCLLACNLLSRQLNDSIDHSFVDRSEAEIPLSKRTRPFSKLTTVPTERSARKKPEVLKESIHWASNLCSFSTRAVSRAAVLKKWGRNIKAAHPNKAAEVKTLAFRKQEPIVATNLAQESRVWTCATCHLGLPAASDSLLNLSVVTHLSKCSGLTRRENTNKLRQASRHSWALSHRNKAGWQCPTWREQRTEEAAQQGHQLVAFKSDHDKAFARVDFRFTCRHCKAFQRDSTPFPTKKCLPRCRPKVTTWMDFRRNQFQDCKAVVEAWGWGKNQVADLKSRKPRNSSGCSPQKET